VLEVDALRDILWLVDGTGAVEVNIGVVDPYAGPQHALVRVHGLIQMQASCKAGKAVQLIYTWTSRCLLKWWTPGADAILSLPLQRSAACDPVVSALQSTPPSMPCHAGGES